MNLKLTEKDIGVLKIISQIAGGFTLIVGLTMIFSLVQLKTINPLDNPVLLSLKDQYDKDPANKEKAEQVRALDLMARKAYFSSRRQVETGSYLLLAGAVIFVFCQRLISDFKKLNPAPPGVKSDHALQGQKTNNYLIITASVISITAVLASLILRKSLPDTSADSREIPKTEKVGKQTAYLPDKTNFPFFRGQDSRGLAGGTNYPTQWNGEEGINIKWKTEIPKYGQSSPVIWDDKIFLTGASGLECEVYCINKESGDILWIGSGSNIDGEPAELPDMDQDAGMAVSTVATNGKVVCAVFANGNLLCFNMNGKLIWSKNIGLPANTYGYSSSLIIYEELLLVQFDSEEKISLIGFDLDSGEIKWETTRSGVPVWSSPVLTFFDGKPQVILNGNPSVSAYDPVSGSHLWSVECMYGDVAPSVAVNSTMVYAVTDYAKLAAIKPGTGASIIWEDNTFTPDVSSPVANDEFLFIATGNGDVACYNAEKGDTLWTHYFMDQFYASPIIADNMVYLIDRSGIMHILKAGPEFQLISESPLGEPTDCTPAFSDSKIYIRGKKSLYSISEN